MHPSLQWCSLAHRGSQTQVIVDVLILHNANVNVLNKKGSTALHLATGLGHASVVESLLNHPEIDVEVQDASGLSPIHVAAARGQAEVLQSNSGSAQRFRSA